MAEDGRGCCDETSSKDDIKEFIKAKYGEAALIASRGKQASCCCGCADTSPITSDLYSDTEASELPPEALLASLGCANPVALADLKPGEVVLDLGCGGGVDVFLSAKRVGPNGKVYGLDMTDEMLALARENQRKAGVENVEFIKGEIENIPLPDNSVDVVLSNCVINLSTDKDKVLREAFRVLKPGGRFAVADIVQTKDVSDEIRRHIALWAGCIAGALGVREYEEKLAAAGFKDIEIKVVRTYSGCEAQALIPQEVLSEIGEEKACEIAGSFASAFIHAVKPRD